MALPELLPCPGCARHVRQSEVECPFCARELGSVFGHPQLRWFPAQSLLPALLAFASVGGGVSACQKSEKDDALTSVAAPSPAAPSANVTAAPAPSPPPTFDMEFAPGRRAIYGAPSAPGPRGNATLGELQLRGGKVANAADVVRGMRGGFRNCYGRGLRDNAELRGTLRVALEVGKTGDVISVTTTGASPLKAQLGSCVETRARASQFEPPAGEPSAGISFDLTFEPPSPTQKLE